MPGGAHRTHKPDAILNDVCKALEEIGAKACRVVGPLGFPDLVVGYCGITILLEVKSGDKPLRKSQTDWIAAWPGQVAVAYSPDMAVRKCIAAALKCGGGGS